MAFLCPEAQSEKEEYMAWPVTRHTQIPLESGFRRLAYGIDSLDIGFYVRWNGRWEALHEALQNKKEQAQRDENIERRNRSKGKGSAFANHCDRQRAEDN